MALFGRLGSILLLLSVFSPAKAILLQANFDNLLFGGGEIVNGSFTYDDDPTCCSAISGSVTGTGGIFTGETIVWDAADVFTFDDSALLGAVVNSTLFNNAALVIFGAPGEWTTVGAFNINPGSFVNRDGILPNDYVSGTITISQVSVPEPSTLALFLLSGVAVLMSIRKKTSNRSITFPGN